MKIPPDFKWQWNDSETFSKSGSSYKTTVGVLQNHGMVIFSVKIVQMEGGRKTNVQSAGDGLKIHSFIM